MSSKSDAVANDARGRRLHGSLRLTKVDAGNAVSRSDEQDGQTQTSTSDTGKTKTI